MLKKAFKGLPPGSTIYRINLFCYIPGPCLETAPPNTRRSVSTNSAASVVFLPFAPRLLSATIFQALSDSPGQFTTALIAVGIARAGDRLHLFFFSGFSISVSTVFRINPNKSPSNPTRMSLSYGAVPNDLQSPQNLFLYSPRHRPAPRRGPRVDHTTWAVALMARLSVGLGTCSCATIYSIY